MKLRLMTCLEVLAAIIPAGSASAFNQPPINLGMTTFLDGGGGPPGIYGLEYVQDFVGAAAMDKNGNVIPGGSRVSVITQLNQIWYLTTVKVFGGYLGIDLSLPAVAVTAKGNLGPIPLTANNAGLGDFYPGLAIQWNDHTLLGRPFFHRVEGFATIPTGSYDKAFIASPGSNILAAEFYHSFTWYFADKWETSWRIGYVFNEANDATRVRPGQVFHFNYAFSREVLPTLRLGAAGYFMQQTTDDQIGGVSTPDTRERAAGLGPGLAYTTKDVLIMLSHPIEFGVQNRFKGSRTTLQFIFHF